MTKELTANKLTIYPLKSAAGVDVESARIGRNGLVGDRTHMVVDQNGNFVSGRKHPEMSRIQAQIAERGLSLSLPGSEELIPVYTPHGEATRIMTSVHGDPVPAIRQNEEADEWIRDQLGGDYRIVGLDPDNHRLIRTHRRQTNTTNRTGFADGAQILATFTESLAALNSHLGPGNEVTMERLRANAVFSGGEAWTEDQMREIESENGVVLISKWACSRCVMTENIPEKGIRDENTRVLAGLRNIGRKGVDAFDPQNRGVFIGANMSVPIESVGKQISLGDVFTVTEHSETPNVILPHHN